MENGPSIEDFPIKTSIYKGFSMAMLNNQMVEQKNPAPNGLVLQWRKILIREKFPQIKSG
jgi:hypothetical protein